MRTEQSQRLEQGLAMTPAMLQSLEVLQLSTAELVERIEQELATNETLVGEVASVPDERERTPSAGSAGDADVRHALLQQVPAPGPDLPTHVRGQLALMDVDDRLEDRVLALVELLDDRGYLTLPDAELDDRFGSPGSEDARALLQSLEPRGLGAHGPIDAMLAQLGPRDPDLPAIERMLTTHLEDLARQRIPDVARALGFLEDEVRTLMERVALLDPRPGARFHERPVRGIRPDLEVREVDGRVEVVVEDLVLPVLTVDEEYRAMAAASEVGREVRSYLRGKLHGAVTLIRAVELRRETLARVGAAVFAEQRPFLRHGERAIRPLKMSDVAERLDLHPSTVSRAVAGKFVKSPQGTHELRAFFDGGRAAAGAVGRRAVLARLGELVDREDRGSPLSDEELATRLRADGIEVARRTVAKYRAELGLPSAALRRRT